MEKKIEIGSLVKSFDFPNRIQGRDKCYIESVLLSINPNGKDMMRHPCYEIKVQKQVWEGIVKSDSRLIGLNVYPPINGTEGMFGKTDCVELA